MTDDRSLERAARAWLEIGPTTAPDRAVDAALLRIQTTNQERDLRIPWRKSVMHMNARLAAFIAVGALAIGGTVAVLGLGDQAIMGPIESPSATPRSTPTAAAAITDPTSAPAIVDLPPLGSTFTSRFHSFSIGMATEWVAKDALTQWAGFDDSWPNVDRLEITGTDSVVDMGSQPLAKGQAFGAWLEDYHADAASHTPPGCDGGPVSSWKTTRVAQDPAFYAVGCDWATAVLSKGGRAFTFSLRHSTSDTTRHLRESAFKLLLESVTLDPVVLPKLDFPDYGGGVGTFGWEGGPGDSKGMHWIPAEIGGISHQAAAMTFSAGPDCLPSTKTVGAVPATIAGLVGVFVEPYSSPVTYGNVADPTTRAYALAVDDRKLCIFVTWNPETTDAERASSLQVLDTIEAQPVGKDYVRITFRLSEKWDTG